MKKFISIILSLMLVLTPILTMGIVTVSAAGDFETVYPVNDTVYVNNLADLKSEISGAEDGNALTIYLENDISTKGDGTITIPANKIIRIMSDNNGTWKINAGNDPTESRFAVLTVAANGELWLENVIITGADNGNDAHGGGIFNRGTVIMKDGAEISYNYAAHGGGVFNESTGTLNMYGDCKITHNIANYPDSAGGVYNAGGTINIENGEISYNEAQHASTGGGGGILLIEGTLNMTGGKISNNIAFGAATDGSGGGGGIRSFFADITIKNAEISNNESRRNGGGLQLSRGNVVIENTVIKDNTASYVGGGICLYVMTCSITDVTITGNNTINSNTLGGGGIFNESGSLTMTGGEISGNTASTGNGSGGGGIYNFNSTFTMTNVKISDNILTNSLSNGGGMYNNAASTFTINSGEIYGHAANYGAGVYNTGGTFIMNGGIIGDDDPAKGNTAVLYGGGVYSTGTFTMNSVEGSIPKISGNKTFQSEAANSDAGNGGGVYNTGTFTMNAGVISKNYTNGNLTSGTSGNGGGVWNGGASGTRTFTMNGGEISENTANNCGGGVWSNNIFTMDSVSGSNPKISDNTANTNDGGGVWNSGTFTMNSGEISGNKTKQHGGGVRSGGTFTMNGGTIGGTTPEAANYTSASGGGVFFDGLSFTMEDGAQIIGNKSSSGGGIRLCGRLDMNGGNIFDNIADDGGGLSIRQDGTLNMYGGEITNNISNNFGGGISNLGIISMTDGKISGNKSKLDGGGIWNLVNGAYKGVITMSGGEISGNVSSQNGGGIYNTGTCRTTIKGTASIINNSAPNGNGGGIYTDNFANLLVTGPDVKFSGNSASYACERDPANDAAYTSAIKDMDGNWTDIPAFLIQQGYSNYDINQVYSGGIVLYVLSYETNGGTPSIEPEFMETGDLISEAEGYETELTKDGYVFAGWYLDEDLTVPVGEDTEIGTANCTIYAKWDKEYTVTFNSNGGSAVDDEKVIEGGTVTKPTDPTKDEYEFGGWYKDAECEEAWDFDEDTVTGDITLYAKWTAIPKYSVTVNSLGTGASGSGEYLAGAIVTINAGTRSGYTFTGWTVTSGGVTVANTSSATFTMPANAVIVTANWTQNYVPPVIDDTDPPANTTEAPTTTEPETTTAEETTTEEETTTGEEPASEPEDEDEDDGEDGENPTEPTIEGTTEEDTTETETETGTVTTNPTEPTADTTTTESQTEPTTEETTTRSATEQPSGNTQSGAVPQEVFDSLYEDDMEIEWLEENATPLSNGWFAVDLGDDWWEIFNESGVPLGVFYLDDGEDIEGVDIAFIEINLLPLGNVTAEIPATVTEPPRENPQTGDSIYAILGLLMLILVGVVIVKRKIIDVK